MTRFKRTLWTAVLLAVAATPCVANDTSSELAAGGLVFVKTDAVAMQREDLTLSLDGITVRYEMRNDHAEPVTLRVAFPMPEVPIDTYAEGLSILDADGTIRAHQVAWRGTVNPLLFSADSDGTPIEPEIDVRADLPDGRNIVQDLRRIGGWWLVLTPRVYIEAAPGAPQAADLYDADRDIGPTILRELREIGAVEGTSVITPRWRTHITYHWQQTFKPGVTVIHHRYRPMFGHDWIRTRDGKPVPDPATPYAAYCVDRAAGVRFHTPAANGGYISALTLGYILTTGANWAGPIETFHLTVDGGHASPGDSQVVGIALCTDVPLQQTSPVHLEGAMQNYWPKTDLRVLLMMDR